MNEERILIATGIYPPDIGGPASYSDTLATKLSKDYKVTLLSYSRVRSLPQDFKKPYKVIRVWKKYPKLIRHLIYFFQVLSSASKNDIILALNAVSAGWPAMMAAKIKGRKFFVKIVGDYAWEVAVNKHKCSLLIGDFQKSNKKGWVKILHNFQKEVCMKADGIIVPSKYLAELVQGWGVDRSKIHIIYNGVEFKPSNLTKEEARKSIGIHGNIIVSAGRLVPWKGFKMLIKIMPRLLEISQFFRLVIAGDGPDRKSLEMMIKNMGLDKKVYLIGKKSPEELAIYLASADVFVLNSGYEGFSHQILEVFAAGVPVIASAVGGNKEVIVQGQNGFLVKYNDEFNLVEAIKGLWKLEELRAQFVEEGKKTLNIFSAEKMYEETMKVIIGKNIESDIVIDTSDESDIPDISTSIVNEKIDV